MKYLFGTNIFIRSKNEMPMKIWPTFWMRIPELMRDGKIFTSVKVKDEIDRGKDELTQWMKDNSTAGFYCNVDTDVLTKYSEVQNWANSTQRYTPTALQDFANVADAYLVATAAAKEMTLVTYEKSNTACKRRVMIPDAGIALGVAYCDLNTVFRNLDVVI